MRAFRKVWTVTRRSVDELAQTITDGIVRGRWRPLLPFQQELAAELGSSSEQVRRALELLRERGLVEHGHTEYATVRRWVPVGTCRVFGSRAEVIAENIAQRLADGRWDVLPTVVAIGAELGVGHDCVTAALRVLQARGGIVRQTSRGAARKWVALDSDGRPVVAETARERALRCAREAMVERISSGEWSMLPTLEVRARELGLSPYVAKTVTHQVAAEGLIQQVGLRGGNRWIAVAHMSRYRQQTVAGLAEYIERRIASSQWTVLPSIKELGQESGLTAPPIIRALRQLAARGLVEKRVGPGLPGGHRWVIAGQRAP